MPQSKLEVYLHFVWATKHRQPVIEASEVQDLYGVIGGEVRRLKGEVLAIGGMPDHVHLLVRFGRDVSLGHFMNQVKGVSSAFLNDRRDAKSSVADGADENLFRWQPGYGAFSVGRNQVNTGESYVKNQFHHHTIGKAWAEWEWAGEEDDVRQNAASNTSQHSP